MLGHPAWTPRDRCRRIGCQTWLIAPAVGIWRPTAAALLSAHCSKLDRQAQLSCARRAGLDRLAGLGGMPARRSRVHRVPGGDCGPGAATSPPSSGSVPISTTTRSSGSTGVVRGHHDGPRCPPRRDRAVGTSARLIEQCLGLGCTAPVGRALRGDHHRRPVAAPTRPRGTAQTLSRPPPHGEGEMAGGGSRRTARPYRCSYVVKFGFRRCWQTSDGPLG